MLGDDPAHNRILDICEFHRTHLKHRESWTLKYPVVAPDYRLLAVLDPSVGGRVANWVGIRDTPVENASNVQVLRTGDVRRHFFHRFVECNDLPLAVNHKGSETIRRYCLVKISGHLGDRYRVFSTQIACLGENGVPYFCGEYHFE